MDLNIFKKKKNIIKIAISVIMLFLILVFMSPAISCSFLNIGSNNEVETETALLKEKNKLVAGTDASYPPFEFLNKEGKVEGFDIDIIREVSNSLDKEIEVENISYDSLFKDLSEGNIDLIISAITVMDDKKEQFDYSESYYVLEYLLLALSDAEVKLKEDLNNKEIGILKIAKTKISEDILSNYRIKTYEDIKIMAEDLRNKEIEGAIVSIPIGVNLLNEVEKPYKIIDKFESNQEFVIALRKNSGILEEINRAIAEIHENNTFEDIYSNWFSFN